MASADYVAQEDATPGASSRSRYGANGSLSAAASLGVTLASTLGFHRYEPVYSQDRSCEGQVVNLPDKELRSGLLLSTSRSTDLTRVRRISISADLPWSPKGPDCIFISGGPESPAYSL